MYIHNNDTNNDNNNDRATQTMALLMTLPTIMAAGRPASKGGHPEVLPG